MNNIEKKKQDEKAFKLLNKKDEDMVKWLMKHGYLETIVEAMLEYKHGKL